MRALIAECKPNSLDDGPGIRFVIFFKGCPLACVWCHNPEMKKAGVELAFDPQACVGSRKCLAVCPDGALDVSRAEFVDRTKCTLCFRCVEVCPSQALQRVGRYWEIGELVETVVRYLPFYSNSGGGVTVSGGEPTLFMDDCSALLQLLRARGLRTLLETCGYFDLVRYDQLIAPYVDQVYFDLKLMDPGAHLRYCGKRNDCILENFRQLQRRSLGGGTPILPRVPLVPGITATAENLGAIARFLRENKVAHVALLPYNPLWVDKAQKLGGAPPLAARRGWMTRDELDSCRAFFAGFEVMG
jgi:pyruvate formate lyase activating enzyme